MSRTATMLSLSWLACVVVCLLTSMAAPAHAATFSWLAKSGTGNWTTPTNWNQGSGYPGATVTNSDQAQFHGDLTGPLGVTLDASVAIQALFLGDSVASPVGSGTFFTTTITTTNASTLNFVGGGGVPTSGTAVFSVVGGNMVGTENLVTPDIFVTVPTLEFRSNLSIGGSTALPTNCGLTGNISSGTTGNHILRYTPSGGENRVSYDLRGTISNGPGTISLYFRNDRQSGITTTMKLSGTGNAFTGTKDFRGGKPGTILEASPASGTGGALGTGRLDLGASGSTATLNLGGSPATVTETCGINIPGTGARRIDVIGAGDRILSGTVNQATTGTLTLACSNAGDLTFAGAIAGTGPITISSTGAGKVTFTGNSSTYSGTTTVLAGGLRLGTGPILGTSTITPLAGGTLSLRPYAQTSVGGLAANAGGLTDVANGSLTVPGLSVTDMLTGLNTGRNGGAWDGVSGITSSDSAASGGTRTVGWLDNGDGSVTFAYAAAGDTNLDWVVDVSDIANFAASGKYGTGDPATWIEGDFNYDSVVDVLDAADFVVSGLYGAGGYNTPPPATGGVAAVPEPAGLGGVALVIAAAIAVRTRR